MNKKLNKLKNILQEMSSVLIAYSGGVDSTLLLKIAKETLKDKVLAVIAKSETYPEEEIKFAGNMAKILKVKYILIKTAELNKKEFLENPPNRCYYCKIELFTKLKEIAKKYKIKFILDGTNSDDLKDFRPGIKAAKELAVRSPLMEAGLTKVEIRDISKKLNLPTWNKPAFACLSSRIPYGERITLQVLKKISSGENFLRDLGLTQLRVRHHQNLARIEVNKEEIPKLIKEKNKIVQIFKKIGYDYITLDLEGYRSGSMNLNKFQLK